MKKFFNKKWMTMSASERSWSFIYNPSTEADLVTKTATAKSLIIP